MSLSTVDTPAEVALPGDAALKTTSILEQARAASATFAPAARPKANPWLKEATHLLRRGHLYAGLFLLPWVFLYGVTAFLFNHPTWFADQMTLTFGRSETAGTALESIPKPSEIAGQVVAALNARGSGGYRLVAPAEARYERGGLSASVIKGDKPYNVTLNAEGDGGTIREGANRNAGQAAPAATKGPRREESASPEGKGEARAGREPGKRGGRGGEGRGGEMRDGRGPRDDAAATPFDVREGLVVAASPLKPFEQALPVVLERAGLAGAQVNEVRAAPLVFLMDGLGKRWLVTYTMATGAVAGRVADAGTTSELSTRRFLTGLHLAHGYPNAFGPRWIWAFIVDIMAAVMVFWGLSGLVMWWQIKRTRRLGAVLLMLSVVAAVYVGVGMHEAMAATGR